MVNCRWPRRFVENDQVKVAENFIIKHSLKNVHWESTESNKSNTSPKESARKKLRVFSYLSNDNGISFSIVYP